MHSNTFHSATALTISTGSYARSSSSSFSKNGVKNGRNTATSSTTSSSSSSSSRLLNFRQERRRRQRTNNNNNNMIKRGAKTLIRSRPCTSYAYASSNNDTNGSRTRINNSNNNNKNNRMQSRHSLENNNNNNMFSTATTRIGQNKANIYLNSDNSNRRTIVTSAIVNDEKTQYDSSSIQVLEGLEPVRKRPGMYIGNTSTKGLHHLVWEILDNGVDEIQANHANRVEVMLEPSGHVSVIDNGRGIPVEIHPKTGKSSLETVLTILHAGGKFGGAESGYSVSGGLHGVGISVVNALSEDLEVTVWRNNKEYNQTFSRGKTTSDLKISERKASKTDKFPKTGTRVRFKPDDMIFQKVKDFDPNIIRARMKELAFLNSNAELRFTSIDNKTKEMKEEVLKYPNGLTDYILDLNNDKNTIHEPITLKADHEGIRIELCLQWTFDDYSDTILGYANSIRTIDGGAHIDGLKNSLTRSFNNAARKAKLLKAEDSNLGGDHIREGLSAVIAVWIPQPEFEGQTKTRLGNPEARKAVEAMVTEKLSEYLEFHPDVLSSVFKKAQAALKASEAAKRARDLVRRKSVLRSSSLPGKLSDCANANADETEIFLVEGDSAGGSCKQGRNRAFQAVLPLRGKILNVERKDEQAMYKNTEIQSMVTALGLGVMGEDFNANNLRYSKIIILTDADVDGAHIRTLLLTFLYRYQKALFEQGHIYVAVPPLFKVESGRKDVKYCYDELELKQYLGTLGDSTPKNLQRFKGLGEMMPQQLWETTLDPKTRTLRRLTVDDAAMVNHTFSLLMSDKVGPRRQFIEDEGPELMGFNLDV
jgi:DNA gyrase subunit B